MTRHRRTSTSSSSRRRLAGGGPRLALGLAIAAFAVVYGALSLLRHRAFSTGRYDLGNMVQAVWSTAHGRPLEVTAGTGEQLVRLGVHVDPILVALVPAWHLWPSPSLLLVVQAVAVALGGLAVFLIAARRLGSELAALGFALAYLLSPAVGWLTLADFHPVALATPLLAFAFWALDTDRLLAFAVFALAAAATKEHVALAVAGLGLWYGVTRGRWLVATAVAAAGGAWTAVALAVVVPRYSPQGKSRFYGRYETVGGSPGGIAETALTEPWRLVAEAADGRGVAYLLALLVPLACLPLLAPAAALAAVPELALNLLSSVETQTSIRYQYSAAALGVLFPAAVAGAARLARARAAVAVRLGGLAAALSLAAGYVLGPLPLWATVPGGEGLGAAELVRSDHDRVAARAVGLVPSDAAVSASSSLGAHLSARRRILTFPVVADARWVIVDRIHPGYMGRTHRRRAPLVLARLRRSPRWALVFEGDGVIVLRRRGEDSAGTLSMQIRDPSVRPSPLG